MKKNAGISTLMVTGLAGFVAVFTMALLIILRGALGPGVEDTKEKAEAEEKASAIGKQFVQDAQGAKINLYWDTVNTALVCASDDNFSVTWLQNMGTGISNVYRVAMLYSSDKLSDVEKFEEAKTKAASIINLPNPPEDGKEDPYADVRAAKAAQQTIAVGVYNYYVETGLETEAKMTVRIRYQNKEKKTQVLEQEFVQPYTQEALTFRAANK